MVCLLCLKGGGSSIFREADEVEMVVMIGKNRFGLVAEVHKELNVSRRAQHGAGIKFVGVGRHSLNFADQGFSHTLAPMSGTHGKQTDHTDAGYRPEAH